jgi:hypothetical protein
MSKKIIAVAAAAALALTALVAPANAAGADLTVLPFTPAADAAGYQGAANSFGTAKDGTTSTAAWEVAVPSQDVLRSTLTASRSVIALEVSTKANNAAITVSSTGSVKLVTAAQLAAATTTTATGTTSLSLTANDSGKATFYAYNTSTSAGSVTVNELSGSTVVAANTKWVKGTTAAANAYKINVVAPTIGGIGSKVEFTATVTDMFGNAVESLTDIDPTTLGGDATNPAAMVWSTTKKIYEGSFTNRTTAGPVALLVPLAVSADSVTAFGAKSVSSFTLINGTDLQAAITALQAEVAALKADYNKLAARWNKKVDNKRTLKKKVALK